MTETTHPGALEGVAWHLTHGVAIPAGVTISARFVDGTVAGHGAVNRYRAQYEHVHGGLRIGPAATTMMGGTPEAMAAEHAYLTLLDAAAGYRLAEDGRSLTLVDGAGDEILWFAASPEGAEALVGRWEVRFVHRGDALVSPTIGSGPVLEFDLAGRVTGFGGVNRLNGSLRVDGDRMFLGPLTSTRMAGSPDVMDDEAALLAALEHVAAWRVDGHALYLLDADGQTKVQLARPDAGG